LTKQDRKAPKFANLLRRDFTATTPNRKWCGDITDIPTDEGKLYLVSVLDLCGRRLLAGPMSDHPDAELSCDVIKMATACAAAGPRSTGSSSTLTVDRPTLQRISQTCAKGSGSGNRWAGSDRVSTTPPARRSCVCPGTALRPRPRPAPS
jgi:hypothetical protein